LFLYEGKTHVHGGGAKVWTGKGTKKLFRWRHPRNPTLF